MKLRLKYAPVPENAGRFADDIARAAAELDGVRLDYSPQSLDLVDRILEGMRAEGVSSDEIAETAFGFGCYVGEVFVRHAGGRWRAATPQESALVGMPLVMALSEDRWCNPIGKAFKRLDNGPEDNLRYFYSVFARPGGPGESDDSAGARE